MVASPELKCSRHAEDSSYASPSQNGGEPVAPSCGVILKGPLDGESVFVDSDGAMPANAPSRAEGGAGEDGVQVAGACCPSATTWTHISAQKKAPSYVYCRRRDAGGSSLRACCMCSRIGAGHWRCCASGRMVRGSDELSSCNGGGPDDDMHIARGFLQQASALPASKRCGRQCQLERLHGRNYVVSPSGTGDDHELRCRSGSISSLWLHVNINIECKMSK
jgi:hypothetical protein